MKYTELRKSIIEDIFNALSEKGYNPENVNLSEIDMEFPSEYIQQDYEKAYDVEKKKYLVNVHHDLTICLEVEAVSEEEACKLAEEKAECIEYEQEPYAENGQLVNEGWTCVNVDSSIIDEIK